MLGETVTVKGKRGDKKDLGRDHQESFTEVLSATRTMFANSLWKKTPDFFRSVSRSETRQKSFKACT